MSPTNSMKALHGSWSLVTTGENDILLDSCFLDPLTLWLVSGADDGPTSMWAVKRCSKKTLYFLIWAAGQYSLP